MGVSNNKDELDEAIADAVKFLLRQQTQQMLDQAWVFIALAVAFALMGKLWIFLILVLGGAVANLCFRLFLRYRRLS